MASSSSSILRVAVAQLSTRSTLSDTLTLLSLTTQTASSNNTSILLFPEAFLGGYPRTCSFGATVGSRLPSGRDQFLAYYKSAVDLGDTVSGAGDEWLERRLTVNKETGYRGDGTREYLEEVARTTGVFIVTGCVERAGGSLYCTALFVDPKRGVIGKRRKVQPTGSERLVWAQGQPSSLKAVATTIKGIRVVMGCAICWENYMPLLRYSLYAQEVNLWLAPTADQRGTWESLMKTVACEGRCWVLSGNQCVQRKDLPDWITGKSRADGQNEGHRLGGTGTQLNGTTSPLSKPARQESRPSTGGRRLSITTKTADNHEIALPLRYGSEETTTTTTEPIPEHPLGVVNDDAPADGDASENEYLSRGGSLIVSPLGETVAGPMWEKTDEILYADIDFDDCARGKLDFDASGHYGRLDAFKLTVEGLDLVPPA